MKIKFLGTGSGLGSHTENFHSNLAIFKNDKILGIDCGSHFQLAIHEAGIDVKDFDAFYITHLHADHIGGLEWVAFKRYFERFPFGTTRPKLFGNVDITIDLWKKSLRGGLESLQGKRNTLKTYFDVTPISPNGYFVWENIQFDLVQTIHVVDDRHMKPSFGLLFTVPSGKRIFFTGDTQFCPNQIFSYYRQADIIFHDCEILKYPESVHAQYHELCTLDQSVKEKMWLYHYGKIQNMPDAKADGFLGFVQKGQEFEF